MKVLKEELTKSELFNNDYVEVKRMGNIVEVRKMTFNNFEMPIVVCEGGKYYYKHDIQYDEDGAIILHDFNHADNRSESKESLRRTFKNLRDLINCNFVGGNNEKFITLTYRQENGVPMRDGERLYKDVEKFIKKMKYHFSDKSRLVYINVVEPQQSGAWHCHILMKFIDVEKIYVPFEKVNEMWEHGTTDIRKIDDCDNIGAYLTAYLCDVVLEENEGDPVPVGGDVVEKEILENGVLVKKKVIKGERLKFYPNNFKLYRPSRGLIRPITEKMKNKDIKKELGCEPNYIQKITIKNENEQVVNQITYEHYNIKKSKNKDN